LSFGKSSGNCERCGKFDEHLADFSNEEYKICRKCESEWHRLLDKIGWKLENDRQYLEWNKIFKKWLKEKKGKPFVFR
jgi:hypothetical protein